MNSNFNLKFFAATAILLGFMFNNSQAQDLVTGDIAAGNLQVGIYGDPGEGTPEVQFFTRSPAGAHIMTYRQTPKGLGLYTNSPFASLYVFDDA